MLRQYTIEIRGEFPKKKHLKVMKKAMTQAARHAWVNAILLDPEAKVTLFSDDFFQGHTEMAVKMGKLEKKDKKEAAKAKKREAKNG